MNQRNFKYITLSFLLAGIGIAAQNPVIQTHFTPDPAPMVYKGKMYIYTGDDQPGFDFYTMTKWRVYSTEDMVNYTDHGSPISLESFSWARDRAWAAQCIERNGKFYWYICVQTVDNNMAIGVAVSDSPTGPFRDALGKPLISTGTWDNIDPTVFIDDDGQAYLYWGNSKLFYVQLNKDMTSYQGKITEIPQSVEAFGGLRRPGKSDEVLQKQEKFDDVYVEGPWLYKRNNQYYMMYAGMTGRTECLSYSTSPSPTGPWKYQGKIMTDQPTNSFTNHGGIIDFKGKSYLFYHTGLLPAGGSYGRSTAVEEFRYNADGTIPKITMTKEGVAPAGTLNPYQRTEAETMTWSEKCSTSENRKTGVYVSDARAGGYIRVRSVDFEKGTSGFSASVAAGIDGGILKVHLDDVKGLKIAEIEIPRTGGWEEFKTLTSKISESVSGVHDVYFVFQGKNITAGRKLFNFDYWSFQKK
ncbi:glycoside hydrolase family 43 protein [Chryseobacterium sp. CKR4-1]|uniref:glycoside hydrolase family 43 protein n=1 Tax=Chryseobacterium sp. CKR4-1 TaxID=3068896 RepID=UPI0027966108|nr:glycoside hydrolase family 43 protein [Chryseobacterium sp. CKR4-1]MDQ1803126.1 glycoside hydrolase family 43 protein [Chryseobacterium sp. CKR4-1]